MLLRVKENELQYLKKEVQCLRDELQMMQKVSPGQLRWDARGVGSPWIQLCPHPVSTCSVPATPGLIRPSPCLPHVGVRIPIYRQRN